MSKFVRPESLSFPQVYHTFQAKNKAGDAEIEYQIKDLPESLFEAALELLTSDFVPDETICAAKNITSNEAALNEIRYFWHKLMKGGFSVGCFANDGSNDLAGLAVMTVFNKGDPRPGELKPNEQDTKDILDLLRFVFDAYDVYSKYNVESYLSECAMCTKKEYRNRGIGTELIRSRTNQLKALGLTLTSTAFTVIGGQKGAVKVNHTDGFQISYDDLQKKYPSFDFSKKNTEFLKIMDFKI
jgi:GNAT superfamily N-acetyltransferase